MAEKLDLYREHKDEYAATEEPRLVETKSARYLTIDGMGEPGGENFRQRLEALYAVAYAVRSGHKRSGRDYGVAKLEALWWGVRGPGDFSSEPKSDWNWKLMIRTPDFVAADEVKGAANELLARGKSQFTAKVRLESLDEGRCVQILHVGPYDREEESLSKMAAFVKERGLCFRGLHHEIYLSDPRRVEPEKLRTLLRMSVC